MFTKGGSGACYTSRFLNNLFQGKCLTLKGSLNFKNQMTGSVQEQTYHLHED